MILCVVIFGTNISQKLKTPNIKKKEKFKTIISTDFKNSTDFLNKTNNQVKN
jgi:hypothetical protein